MINDRDIDELLRKGEHDQSRLAKKIKEHLRKNIRKYILEEALVTGKGKKKVKVQIKSLELPEFKFGDNDNTGVGSSGGKGKKGGQKARGQPKPGDQPGQGEEGAGEGSTDHSIEAEVDIDLIVELAFKELGLPDIKESVPDNLMSTVMEFDQIRRSGPISMVDKRRTIMANMKRNAQKGSICIGGVQKCDLRFRTYEEREERSNKAVVIAMMDVSGSMGEEKKFLVRVSLWWIKKYLDKIYDSLAFEFIIHDTEAHIVDEEKFFKSSTGGGTAISSAFTKAVELIERDYDPCVWNIYSFHFSDGENFDNDNPKAINLLKKLLLYSRRVYYGQVGRPTGQSFVSTLEKAEINKDRLITAEIRDRDDVAGAIEKFLYKGGKKEDG